MTDVSTPTGVSPTSPRSAALGAEYVVVRVSASDGEATLMTDEPIKYDPDRLLTGPECARLVGVVPGTWRSLVKQGYAPPADEPDLDRPPHMRMPRWKASAVAEFRANRPGRGGKFPRKPKEADGGDK